MNVILIAKQLPFDMLIVSTANYSHSNYLRNNSPSTLKNTLPITAQSPNDTQIAQRLRVHVHVHVCDWFIYSKRQPGEFCGWTFEH